MQTNGNLGKSLIYSESSFSELIFHSAAVFLIFKSCLLQYILFHNLNSLTNTVLYQSKRLNSKENQMLLYVRVHLVMFYNGPFIAFISVQQHHIRVRDKNT